MQEEGPIGVELEIGAVDGAPLFGEQTKGFNEAFPGFAVGGRRDPGDFLIADGYRLDPARRDLIEDA